MQKLFFILSGNNGATYIINTASWANINASLRFYRAHSFKSKFLKNGLALLLWCLGKLKLGALQTTTQINAYCSAVVKSELDLGLNSNCAVLISPTKDKIIVHHFNVCFHKFAFGSSYANVKKESYIYKVLGKPKQFSIAQISQLHDNTVAQSCSFKLQNPKKTEQAKSMEHINLPLVLSEFFNTQKNSKTITVAAYIDGLVQRYKQAGQTVSKELAISLEVFKTNHGQNALPLGVVHRDFKPWNTLMQDKLLIFDFEETVLNGPPLEDLINYYIDPIIKYRSADEIYKVLILEKNVDEYKSYLKYIGLKLPYQYLIITYLLERIVFWSQTTEVHTAESYKNLLHYVVTQFNTTHE